MDARSAQMALTIAKRQGKVIRALHCELCGIETRTWAHHWRGYEFPLDVWWICARCNGLLRNKHDGIMTKEAAIAFIADHPRRNKRAVESNYGGARKGAGRKANRYALQPWRGPRDVKIIDTTTGKEYGTEHQWGGWEWWTANGRNFRTDGRGEGLWMWIERDQDWKQQTGTMQYWLPQDREKALRKLLRSEGLAPRVIGQGDEESEE